MKESCDNCGASLIRYGICSECRKITQKMCTKCGTKFSEFHEECFYYIELRSILRENPPLLSTV